MEKILKEMREKYVMVLSLTNKAKSKQERRAAKVNAQTILLEMKNKLRDALATRQIPVKVYDKLLGMLIIVMYKLGTFTLELGNLKEGLNYLDKVISLIPDSVSLPTPNYVRVAMEARNVFGAEYIYLNPTVAAMMIDEADRIFYNYKKAFPKRAPYSLDDHFAEDATDSGKDQLNGTHSLTKFYLRQFSRPVQYYYKSLEHAYRSLRKMATAEVKELSPAVEVTIILAEYFINEREFHYGRYLLSIAAYFIDKFEENTKDLVASMKALDINEKKMGAETSAQGKKSKQVKYFSMMVEKGKKEAEIPLKKNEVLVEVEDGQEETDSSEEVNENEQDSPYEVSGGKMYGRSASSSWIELEEPTIEEEIKGWRAFLTRTWVRYGIHLMRYASQAIKEPKVEVTRNLPKFPKIQNLDLSKYENKVTDEFPKTIEEAQSLFMFTQNCLIAAKNFYTLDTYAHETVALAQEHSLLIRYMMKFVQDDKTLRKLMKARIEALESIALQLNHKYYLPACRLLWFELGKCYHDLVQYKFDSMVGKKGDALYKTAQRVNNYSSSGMVHVHNYIDSFRNKNAKATDPVPADVFEKLALAHFYLGRMYYAYITFDREESKKYSLIACASFRYVVKHCKKEAMVKEAIKYQEELLEEIKYATSTNKLFVKKWFVRGDKKR